MALFILGGVAQGQGQPPFPHVLSGKVTIGGSAAPDGTNVWAKIGDYTSSPVMTSGGSYQNLTVGPPDASYVGKTIELYAGTKEPSVIAAETAVFTTATIATLDLTFPALPTAGDPGLYMMWIVAGVVGLMAIAGGVFALKRS